jgi:hypothetical protein
VNFCWVSDKGFDLHLSSASRAGEGVDFEYHFDEARPGRGGFEGRFW